MLWLSTQSSFHYCTPAWQHCRNGCLVAVTCLWGLLWHSPLECADIMCWQEHVGPVLPASPTPWSSCRENHETIQRQQQNVCFCIKLCVCVCMRLTRRRRRWQSFCCQSECSAPAPRDLPALANMLHTLCPITWRKRRLRKHLSKYTVLHIFYSL